MKIATYHDGSRDGQLVVVSRDLSLAHYATAIAGRMQQLLDDWNFLSPQLEDLSQTLNHGKARHAFAFEPLRCMAPLPRVFCFAAVDPPVVPADAAAAPRMRTLRGDACAGPHDPVPLRAAGSTADGGDAAAAADDLGIDLCPQPAVITGTLAAGTAAPEALASIRLITLACSWHRAQPDDGWRVDGWCPVSFAPVALTPDELGGAWSDGCIDLAIAARRGGKAWGRSPTAVGHAGARIGELLAACAQHGGLGGGSVVALGMPEVDPAHGGIAIGPRRRRERAVDGAARTPYLGRDEALRIEAIDRDGRSPFGAIEPSTRAAT